MTKIEFATILGIKKSNYNNLRLGMNRAKVSFTANKEERIKYKFSEDRFYDLSYFEEVCKKYNCTLKDVIQIVVIDNDEFTNLLLESLLKKQKLYIGKKRIDNSFMEKYGEYLIYIGKRYSFKLGKIYNTIEYSEDIVQDVLTYMIQYTGMVVENYSEENAIETLKRYLQVAIKHHHLRKLQRTRRNESLDEEISYKDTRTKYSLVKNEKSVIPGGNFEQEEIIDIEDETTPILAIQKYLSNGMNKKEAMQTVMSKFNITQKELYEIILREIESKKTIKQTKDGQVYLDEK